VRGEKSGSIARKIVNAYRYGFNGKENDNDVKGEGNQQDYGLRIYDPRLGRFLSVDPLFKEYPYKTSYDFAENSPILGSDLDGAEIQFDIFGNRHDGPVNIKQINLALVMSQIKQNQKVGTGNNSTPNQQGNLSMNSNLVKNTLTWAGATNDVLSTIAETTTSNFQITRTGKFRTRTSVQNLSSEVKASSKNLGRIGTAINVATIGIDGVKLLSASNDRELQEAKDEGKQDLVDMGVDYILGRAHPVLPILNLFIDKASQDPSTQQGILNDLRKKANGPNKSLKDVKRFEEYQQKINPSSSSPSQTEIKPAI
jgi:RHS repeat-associated protein